MMRGSWMLAAALAAMTGCVYPLEQGRQLERRVDELGEDLTKSRQRTEESERRATADRQQLKAEQETSIQRLNAALAESVKRLDDALAEMNRRVDVRMLEVTKRVEELNGVAKRSGADLALEQDQQREKLSHAAEQIAQLSADLAVFRSRLAKVSEAADSASGLPARIDELSGLQGSTTTRVSGLADRLGSTDEKLAQAEARIKALTDRLAAAEAGRKESELPPALRLLAATQSQRLGDTAGARALLRSIIEQHPRTPVGDEAHFALGELELAARQFPAALEQFRELTDRKPAHARAAEARVRIDEAQFGLGEAAFAARQFPVAIGHFKELTERKPLHPRTIEAQLRVGQCFLEMKDPRKARLFLELAVETGPQTDAGRKANDLLLRMDDEESGTPERPVEKPAAKPSDKKPEKKSDKASEGKRDRSR